MEWLTPLLAAVVSILTGVFAWLKIRDEGRFKGIDTELDRHKVLLAEAKARVKELEEKLRADEQAHRLAMLSWDKERMTLVQELVGLRAAVARMEIGATAAIVVADGRGEIVDSNPTATELLGWTKEELCGKDVRLLIPFRYRDAHEKAFLEVSSASRPMRLMPLEGFALSRTGQEIPVRIALTSWDDDGKKLFAAELRRRST